MSAGLWLGLFGLATSFINGLLGGGGAVVLIPAALYLLPLLVGSQLEPHQISGLVLVQSVASAIGGGLGFQRRGQIEPKLVLRYGPGLAAGGLGGALASSLLPGRILLIVFAVVTSAAALLMLMPPRTEAGAGSGRALAGGAALAVIGVLGGTIGIGAGFLIIPVLLYVLGTPARVASGSALVLSIFLSAPALLGKALTGQVPWSAAALLAVTALAGSRAGAQLSARVPVARLRLALAGLIGLLALRIWAGLAFG